MSLKQTLFNISYLIGILSFVLLIIGSLIIYNPTKMSGISSFKESLWSLAYTTESRKPNEVIRSKAIELTKNCSMADDYCLTISIYNYLNDFNYTIDAMGGNKVQKPEYTLLTKRGDCDGLSILNCALLSNVGVECNVRSSHNHAWNEIFIRDGDSSEKLIVDIASQWFTFNVDFYYGNVK